MEYQCPFCDYQDTERRAVEAHISGATYSDHDGKVGKLYRSDIEQNATPESVKERLFGDSPERQSMMEEVEEIEETVRAVERRNQALEDTVQNLREEVQELQDDVMETKEETEDSAQLALEMAKGLNQSMTEHRLAIEEASKHITQIRTANREDEGLILDEGECPDCGKDVRFHEEGYLDEYVVNKGEYIPHLTCSNCSSIQVTGYLSEDGV